MPRKRKSTDNENGNTKVVATKKKAVAKKKADDVDRPVSPQAPEKHLVIKIFVNAQTNEAFHPKYIKELKHQYEQVNLQTLNEIKFLTVMVLENRLDMMHFLQCSLLA